MPAPDEIDTRLKRVLVDALGVEGDAIKPSATLQRDLGAESIDFLDIAFRLEREFMIKIPRGELFSELVFTDAAEIVQDGRLTDQGLEKLRAQMPFADLSWFERHRRLDQVNDLFTVDLLSSYVTWKLRACGTPERNPDGLALHHSAQDLALSATTTGM